MTSGGVRFETTKKAVLLKGETYVDVPASAVEAGVSGNAIAGAIHLMSVYPVGITQCTNPEAFSGGSDEESDEKLRERVLASYKRLPNGANAAFYEQEAMSFPNVAAAKAVGRARGIGTVDVYVSTHAARRMRSCSARSRRSCRKSARSRWMWRSRRRQRRPST